MSDLVVLVQVMCSMVSMPQKFRAALAMAIELVSSLPAGLPAMCQVMSQKSGPPAAKRSKRPIRFVAPAGVRGGKNSSEKKRSPPFTRDWIFSMSVAGAVEKLVGEDDRGVPAVEERGVLACDEDWDW